MAGSDEEVALGVEATRPAKKRKSDKDPEDEDDEPEPAAATKPKRKTDALASPEAFIAATREGDAYIDALVGSDPAGAAATAFAIISKARWRNVERMQTQLLSTGLVADRLIWVVGLGEAGEYSKAGALGRIVEGGGLCASRNAAMDEARNMGCRFVVEVSDDLQWCTVIREGASLASMTAADGKAGWSKPKDMAAQNVAGNDKLACSLPAAAKLLRAVMGGAGKGGARLGGGYPNTNYGLAAGCAPLAKDCFIVGDFVVVDVERTTLRFDERIALKEDYDYTAQHLYEHGSVARSNRILAQFEHYKNAGGAVDARTDDLEQRSIAILRHKWPGAFPQHTTRGENEVRFRWDSRGSIVGGKHEIKQPPPPAGVDKAVYKPKGGQRTVTSFFAKRT
ncbi:hypothetical protein M885DRAFT_462980 [Pelagophyceae sp. CCMP2097]|nr:hypothetical protein M885DRAFT_462980 [Pelagophyceae sp. CCMP2097]